jgi:hypothetical protein
MIETAARPALLTIEEDHNQRSRKRLVAEQAPGTPGIEGCIKADAILSVPEVPMSSPESAACSQTRTNAALSKSALLRRPVR